MLSRRSLIQLALSAVMNISYPVLNQDKKYSFEELPADKKPHELTGNENGTKTIAISWPGLSSFATCEDTNNKSEGSGYCSIVAFKRTDIYKNKSRDLLLYLDVSPLSSETKVASQSFSYREVDPLLTKLNEILRIGRNMRDAGTYNKSTSLSPINNIVFSVYGDESDERLKKMIEEAKSKNVASFHFIYFSITNTEKNYKIDTIDLKDVHILINSINEAKKWMEDEKTPLPVKDSGYMLPPPRQSRTYDTVFITEHGKKYHRAGCSSLRSTFIPITKDRAIVKGYTPCSLCHP
jgi:hypothetical protein